MNLHAELTLKIQFWGFELPPNGPVVFFEVEVGITNIYLPLTGK